MQLTFASYNIHKAVGLDRRRDPERILSVLREIDADVIALQEADMRFGQRAAVLSRAALDDTPWRIARVARRARSIGWHGNALLIRRGFKIVQSHALVLPTLEPRGAVATDILMGSRRVRVVGAHLDLSGLRRRDQINAILHHLDRETPYCPTVLLGDFNQWGLRSGAMQEFGDGWHLIAPGRSYPSRRPLAQLDRIVASKEWLCEKSAVHHSATAAAASDHLPVWARLKIA